MKYITIELEYPDEVRDPLFHGKMIILGGRVTSVKFGPMNDYEEFSEDEEELNQLMEILESKKWTKN